MKSHFKMILPEGRIVKGGIRMRRTLPLPLLALAAVILNGCASGLVQRIDEQQAALDAMQARVDEMARQNEAQDQETEAVQRDVSQIGLKVTQTEEQVSGLSNRVENLNTRVSLLTEDVTRMKAGGTQTMTPPMPGGTALQFSETPGTVPGNVQAVYDGALRLYYDERPREAIAEFNRAKEAGPESDLADNADYWIGECYYKLEELPEALQAFRRVFDHSFTDKYDDAQLKVGMTLRLMGQRDEAIAAFRELLERYADSPYRGYAERYIRELGGGGF